MREVLSVIMTVISIPGNIIGCINFFTYIVDKHKKNRQATPNR